MMFKGSSAKSKQRRFSLFQSHASMVRHRPWEMQSTMNWPVMVVTGHWMSASLMVMPAAVSSRRVLAARWTAEPCWASWSGLIGRPGAAAKQQQGPGLDLLRLL
jgi:hypothetical protein